MPRRELEKGKRGEREVAELIRGLLGVDCRRRVRQHDGDSDLLGVQGWTIEVKRREDADLRRWWEQAAQQAEAGTLPALFYRRSRRPWRVVWPLSALMSGRPLRCDYSYTVESSPEAWAELVKERSGGA